MRECRDIKSISSNGQYDVSFCAMIHKDLRTFSSIPTQYWFFDHNHIACARNHIDYSSYAPAVLKCIVVSALRKLNDVDDRLRFVPPSTIERTTPKFDIPSVYSVQSYHSPVPLHVDP